jgi:hypothetical protein
MIITNDIRLKYYDWFTDNLLNDKLDGWTVDEELLGRDIIQKHYEELTEKQRLFLKQSDIKLLMNAKVLRERLWQEELDRYFEEGSLMREEYILEHKETFLGWSIFPLEHWWMHLDYVVSGKLKIEL